MNKFKFKSFISSSFPLKKKLQKREGKKDRYNLVPGDRIFFYITKEGQYARKRTLNKQENICEFLGYFNSDKSVSRYRVIYNNYSWENLCDTKCIHLS